MERRIMEQTKSVAKKIVKVFLIIVIAIIVLVIFFGSFYSVNEQQQAVVTMFGNVVRVDSAGLHFKVPLLQQAHKVDITTHGTGIGYSVSEEGQNIESDDQDSLMITSDFNFVDIDFYLEYRVNDPVAYLYNSDNPEMIMKNITLACIRSTVTDYPVDEVITTGKSQIQAEVKEKLSNALAEQNIGLQIINLSIQDAEPPTSEIIQEFKAVETAKQGRETAINNARKYQNEQIPNAEAQADKIIQAADAAKQARIAEAEGQASRFEQIYNEYRNYPLITKQRLFYEYMEDVLPDLKVIVSDGNTQKLLPLDSFSNGSFAGDYSVPEGSEDTSDESEVSE